MIRGSTAFCLVVGVTMLSTSPGPAAANDYDLLEVPEPKRHHLFFNDLRRIGEFESTTVFFTEGVFDPEIADAFFVFAERIGLKNGATTVDVGDYAAYADALTRLGCPAIAHRDLPAVVFTARRLDYCQVFPVEQPAALREILFTIERNLDCPTDLLLERILRETKNSVSIVARNWQVAAALERPAFELVDFIGEQLRVTCRI